MLLLVPLIEWVCVAAIPTLLCVRKTLQFSSWPLIENVEVLFMTFIIISTSILTLIAIVLFGDNVIESGNTDVGVKSNSRGTGLVMGSHLMPLLYMSIQIFVCNNRCNDSTDDEGLVYLKLAIFGGLAFAVSNLYKRWQHSKFHSGRLKSSGCEHFEGSNKITKQSQQRHMSSIMQFASSIYIILLMGDLVVNRVQRSQQRSSIPTIITGLLHASLIASHSGGKQQYSWQNAFTPGEWMT
eukprot:scaffold183190_cov41-Cyclotella_meneghiniana.AAC.1